MRHVRFLCATTLLTCVLAQTAWADDGVIHGGLVPPPPQALPSSVTSEAAADQSAVLEPTVELALDFVRSMLSLY